MKKKSLLIVVVFLGLGIIWWLFMRHSSQNSTSVQPLSPTNTVAETLQKQQLPSPPAVASKPAVPEAVMEYVKKIKADPQYDWKQPINFWGRVIDESNNPVAGATISFEWNDISPTGTSKASTTSDGNGLFSLTDRRGKRLYIDVSKEGYYSTGNARNGTFEYANPADGLFKPDQNNPVVFRLRKKRAGVDLITSHAPMSTFIRITSPTNGSPVFLNFFNQKIGDKGQLKIEGWKELKDRKTAQNNWGFRLTVPDGGLIEENDEFPFEAPEEGYQSVTEWHFTDGSPDWRGGINKKFYIKFGNPPRYGKITVQTGAFRPAVDLEYAINPDGSRYLEPK